MAAPPRPCAACGGAAGSTLACLACGAVLREEAGATHFDRLGLPPSATVDADAAEATYLKLSRILHPDAHARSDDETQMLALTNSALLNDAWRALTDEQACAEYALGLRDAGALERTKQLDPAFLMEAMELSERVEAARAADDDDTLARIAAESAAAIRERMERAAAEGTDADAAATALHEARVHRRIIRDVEGAR